MSRSSMVLNAIGNMRMELKWQYWNSKILAFYAINIVIYPFCVDHMLPMLVLFIFILCAHRCRETKGTK
jgi:hypothetical protein